MCVCMLSCVLLCNSMDCSPPGSSIHGVFQARIMEWVAISYSRGSSQPRDRLLCLLHCQVDSLLHHLESPIQKKKKLVVQKRKRFIIPKGNEKTVVCQE